MNVIEQPRRFQRFLANSLASPKPTSTAFVFPTTRDAPGVQQYKLVRMPVRHLIIQRLRNLYAPSYQNTLFHCSFALSRIPLTSTTISKTRCHFGMRVLILLWLELRPLKAKMTAFCGSHLAMRAIHRMERKSGRNCQLGVLDCEPLHTLNRITS